MCEKHQWQQMYPQRHQGTCVYKLMWQDKDYIGMTKKPLPHRLSNHLTKPVNQEVTARLTNRNYPKLKIIKDKLTRTEALKLEQTILNNYPKKHRLLNWHYKNGHLHTRKTLNCFLCNIRQPAEAFYKSKHRSCGRASMCIKCRKLVTYAMHRTASYKEGYHMAKNLIQNNPKAGNKPKHTWPTLFGKPHWTILKERKIK